MEDIMNTDPNSEHIALAEHALSAPAAYLLEPLDVNQLASFLSSHDELWAPTNPGDIGTGPLHGFCPSRASTPHFAGLPPRRSTTWT
jgi:hypothetical protein